MMFNGLSHWEKSVNNEAKIMCYRKFSRHGEQSLYHNENIDDLLFMFEKYIDAYEEDKLMNRDKAQNHYLRKCILKNNPLLIERAFIFCCAKNDLPELKSIYDLFIDNRKWDTNKGAKKIFEKTRHQCLFKDICGHCHIEIIKWIVAQNILVDIEYDNIIIWLCEEMSFELVYSVLDTIYSHNPNVLIESFDTLKSCFRLAICYLDFKVMNILQMYRPFQFGCYFDNYIEQNKIQKNYYKINFIGEDNENFDCVDFIKKHNNFELDYDSIKKRMDFIPEGYEISFREELMRNRFHPKNIDKWINWGHCEHEDFE